MNPRKAALLLLVLPIATGCSTSGSKATLDERADGIGVTEPLAEKTASSKPRPRSEHYLAARAALLDGDREKAGVEAKLALQQDALDPQSHFLLACLLEQEGESDQAMVGFRRALSLDPLNADAEYNLGTMLLWRGDAVAASSLLENAVSIRPDHVPSYNNLAKSYFASGLPELALATYEEALRRDSSNVIALANLMLLTEAAGMHEAAEDYRRRLAALRSNAPSHPSSDTREVAKPLAAKVAGVVGDAVAPTKAASLPEVAPDDPEANALREMLRDLTHVKVERRGGRLTLIGWTRGPKERAMLDKILGGQQETPDKAAPPAAGKPPETPPKVAVVAPAPAKFLDLTSDDSGDPQHMLEIDAVLFIVKKLAGEDVGFDFLKEVNLNFNYVASGLKSDGSGFSTPGTQISSLSQPTAQGTATWATSGAIDDVNGLSQSGWIFGAAVDYVVNIANASNERVAVLAQPHLTTLSGTPAKFLAGGELVYQVSGLNTGDIRPYPFGTSLSVTPTLLQTHADDGTPQVHIVIEAERTSVLSLLDADPNRPTSFDKLTVDSQAVLRIGETLVLSGLSQRESHTGRSGTPILMDIPILKYFFSKESTLVADTAIVILLTPRDPAFIGQKNREALAAFIEKRRAFLRAKQGTEEDMQLYREKYPDWDQLPPNRFASHFILMSNSDIYREVSPQQLSSEDVDLQLLGPYPKLQ